MTIAVLSWGSHKTLTQSLKSYQKYGLDTLDEDRVIFFQEYSEEDKAIAEEFNWESIGSPTNIGIAEAYKLLVAFATDDLFLFLENDWELIEKPHKQISEAADLLKNHEADVIRLRHRDNPGEPLYSRQFKGHENTSPQHMLDCVHWDKHPENFAQIEKIGNWYLASSRYANWTNNPTMFRTGFLREFIVPRMSGDIEKAIQPWWAQNDFYVMQGQGLFTHNRIDR